MIFRITEGGIDPSHWKELSELWANSAAQCPFQSRSILRHHAGFTNETVLVYTGHREGQLMAAVILKKNSSDHLTFLSDLKTDVNHFLFHQEVTSEEKAAYFDHLLQDVQANDWSLTLNNQPGEADHLDLLMQHAEDAGLFSSRIPYSARPVVEAATPNELFDHVNGLRELRYRVNRLRKRPDVEFEVMTDDRDLGGWVREFCDVHVLRWAGTDTPSHLDSAERRTFLEGCLRAWSVDDLLVRFAIKVAGHRIGFVVGLRNGATLVHHSTTYHPEHAKASPGKALILFMAEWMATNGYRVLDFGDGREQYKYTVANAERPLHRIFISRKSNYRYILSSKVIERTRKSPLLYNLYQKHIKRILNR